MSYGRTKHTEDDEGYIEVLVRGDASAKRAAAILRLVIIASVLAFLVWLSVSYLVRVVGEPGREQRIAECAQAMDSELLGHANDSCTGLSKDEQREAAYRWARETGRL